MLAAIALGAGQPLPTMQLRWINLINDIFPGLALALEPPEADVLAQPPRDPKRYASGAAGNDYRCLAESREYIGFLHYHVNKYPHWGKIN